MQTLKRTFVAMSAVALLSVPMIASAQDPPSAPRTPQATPQTPPSSPQTPAMPQERPSTRSAGKEQTAKGELVSVDEATKMITIKDDTGAELKFAYDDKTDVAGAKDGVAGLATKSGTKVNVKYTEEAGAKKATKIEVQRGASSPSQP